MSKHGKPRALVIVGAGASVEFGIPGTIGFGELIDDAVRNDAWCSRTGGTDVYFEIRDQLLSYYQSNAEAHFERVYHVLHELGTLRLTPGAIPKFRPVMYPFIKLQKPYEDMALRSAAQAMLQAIYTTCSGLCGSPKVALDSLKAILSILEDRFVPRIYTTNYDDFLQQSGTDNYVTGFTRAIGNCQLFDPEDYWSDWDRPGCFHIHGSVRMGFPHSRSGGINIGEIGWFHSRADALPYGTFNGSGIDRMDGTGLMRSAIITGLDKLGRLQQSPFASYYAGLAREAMEADVIFVLGSGLADLHLNTWLKAARERNPRAPLLFVGYMPGTALDFYSSIHFDNDPLGISLFHELHVDLANIPGSAFNDSDGWTIAADGTAAVWMSGFQSFLSESDALNKALAKLGVP